MINLEPTEQELEEFFVKFLKEEDRLPEVSRAGFFKRLFFIIIFLILNLPFIIIINIFRLPFYFFRRFRVKQLEGKARIIFRESHEWDPDNWREFHFEEPRAQRGKSYKKQQLLEEGGQGLEKWLENSNDYDSLIDYVVVEVLKSSRSSKWGLFVFVEIERASMSSKINRGNFYWNFNVFAETLKCYRKAFYFREKSKKHGYVLKKISLPERLFGWVISLWITFTDEVDNCWPSLS